MLGLTLILVAGLVVALNVVKEGTAESMKLSLSRLLCYRLSAEISSMHHIALYGGYYESHSRLELPDRIGGERYIIMAEGNLLEFRDRGGNKISGCIAPTAVSGSAEGGGIEIRLNASAQPQATIEVA